MIWSNWILAQTPAPTGTGQGTGQGPGGPWVMIVWLALIFVVFWFLLLRPKQREQKQREKMLGCIKKYDKVLTLGGIIGTVMEIREDEVILKVDDSTNTRMKFVRGAIQRVLSSSESDKGS